MPPKTVRKKDITTFYKKRSELTVEDAEEMFCKNDILNLTDDKYSDSIKLNVYLLLERLGAEKTWQMIKTAVVQNNPSKAICLHIGTVLRKAYRDALVTTPAEGIVTRSDVASIIFKPLMQNCILVKRIYAEKFCLILRGATLDRDENLSQMLFEMSRAVVWRYLKAPNAHVRQGAFFVQCCVFPPSSGNGITDVDYLNEHCEAFVNALKDESIDTCLEAIENVCEILSMYYELIPDLHKDKIFNEFVALTRDDNYKIRSALYHGLRHFHECAVGIKKFEILLKAICRRGIDDTSDHVRCNVFRLLKSLGNSKIKIIELSTKKTTDEESAILSAEDVLYRLDFEESEAVQREISALVFSNFFERDISNENRYKMLNQLCRINRNACLDFHRLIYSLKLISGDCALSHLSNTLVVCANILKSIISRQNENENETMETSDAFGNDTTVRNREINSDLNKHLQRFKNVVDCMVVCYATMRYDPNFDANVLDALVVARHFSEIAHDLMANFDIRTDLLDSALSIIALVRNAGVHSTKIKKTCSKMLCSGDLNARYLEIFGLIDMDELLKILQDGLDQLESSLFDTENTPKPKRTNHSTKFLKKECVIEAINVLLNLPSCNQYIVEKFMHWITKFISQLKRICDTFIENFRNDTIPKINLLFECWKLLSILLILKHNQREYFSVEAEKKQTKTGKRQTPSAPRSRSTIILSRVNSNEVEDPLLYECNWMKETLEMHPELSSNADLIEFFYQTISLHFSSYKHLSSTAKKALEIVKEIHELGNEYPPNRSITQSYKACEKAGKSALEYAEPDSIMLAPLTEVDEE